LAAIIPTCGNGGYGFGEAKNDKCPDTPGLVNSRQNSFFVFFFHSLPFLLSKNLTKQKFYSKIKQKRKEVKFLYNKKTNLTPDILSGKNKKGDPMKKAYSLNYDIYSTYDRIDAIAEILDELPQTPNHTDLEQMADYILYGKDDQNLSVVDTKEILQPKRRYSSFQTKAEETESLDTLLEDPVVAQDIENNAKPVSPENKSPYKVFK
jgi:hypothetical protein